MFDSGFLVGKYSVCFIFSSHNYTHAFFSSVCYYKTFALESFVILDTVYSNSLFI